ncbi:DUF4936 family protein [Variovorax sp. YR752]|uniref:DUF4936 family protein n=1 Tax=Variovorax sp. YR752 TaxID=1884383 RepID=UPI003137E287
MRELFIYYRSPVHHAEAVMATVHAFQAQLSLEHPGLLARLLRRPEVKGGQITWMETYSIATMTPGPALDDTLQQQIESRAASLHGLIDGDRHTEVFAPCAC